MPDRLFRGDKLLPSQILVSTNRRYALVMQTDGNIVLYPIGRTDALWASGTSGRRVAWLAMQDDGNLVLYSPSGSALWSSGTHGDSVAYAVLQDDGNFVIYRPDGHPLWSTGTNQSGVFTNGLSPASTRFMFYNESGHDVWVKPENGDRARRVPDGGHFEGPIDGIADPHDASGRIYQLRGDNYHPLDPVYNGDGQVAYGLWGSSTFDVPESVGRWHDTERFLEERHQERDGGWDDLGARSRRDLKSLPQEIRLYLAKDGTVRWNAGSE